MMVPRAFLYSSTAPTTSTVGKDKPRGSSRTRRKGSSTETIRGVSTQEIAASLDIVYSPPPPLRTKSAPMSPPTASNPVVIPKSRRSSRDESVQDAARRRPSRTDTIVTVIRDGDVNDRGTGASSPLKPHARSVAELLAVTKIIPPKRMLRRPRRDFRSESLVEDFNRLLVEDIKARDDGIIAGSFGNGSLDILLSPPNESSIEDDESLEAKGIRGSPSSVRSISSESMPSLLTDDESNASVSVPITPALRRKGVQDRPARMLSSSEDCGFDHPLLTPVEPLDPALRSYISTYQPPASKPKPVRSPPAPRPASSSFKSNLTASLRALKLAAQSVSNFTSSSTPQEDFLTRSLFSFSPEMTDDRRPPPSSDPPSPALRRYLNPVPSPLVPSDLHLYNEHPTYQPTISPFANQGQTKKTKSATSPLCTASIQLQSYRRSSRPSNPSIATAPPLFASPIEEVAQTSSPSEIPFSANPLSRTREPRENSDFLRMVVCEMEMRRKGKFRDDVPGRARIWLPARKSEKLVGQGRGKGDGVDTGGGVTGLARAVPRRWHAILAEE